MPHDRLTPARSRVAAIALCLALGPAGVASPVHAAQEGHGPGAVVASRRMADGKEWTTVNLNAPASPSYCYGDVEANGRQVRS